MLLALTESSGFLLGRTWIQNIINNQYELKAKLEKGSQGLSIPEPLVEIGSLETMSVLKP